METATPGFFQDRGLKLLLFGGKGGVGKTTCAVAGALRLARSAPEGAFFLVSTDPAHSLTDSLAGSPPPYNLEVLELDAQKCMVAFKEKHARILRQIAARGTFLDDGDISRFLDLSLPGLDELMAFLEIAKGVEEGGYDCMIVDTAPTGHALRLLEMPELMGKWLKALDALLAKHRYMKQHFSGSYSRDEVDEFLLDLSGSVQRMEALLGDPGRCRFIPVMLPEALSIHETLLLLDELERLRVPVADIVVNKLFPESSCSVCANERLRQRKELQRLPEKFSRYRFWGVPIYPTEVRGRKALGSFWKNAASLEVPAAETENAFPGIPSSPPRVEMPAQLPSPETRLLLFAGKGGVGKTTLATATALRLARSLPGREVFLFSSDPAHSLSDCLETPVGPEPVRIAPGLTVMEIDSLAEFEKLKNQYAEELEDLLGALSPNLDLTFDREVMERLMDLSPSGLDEVMALTLATEFLSEGKYDVIILDSAPTGHLIRLLELPELIDQWLKVFFDLTLKYRQIFRLPRISLRLVQISKDLKYLRNLLRDSRRSSLYAVTILTEMAFEETKDLIAACERMDVHVPALFLNLATTPSNCPLCPALCRRESQLKARFQQAFSHKHHTLVYRRGEPRGLERLGELGERLYLSEPRALTSKAL